jgi:hypothetical protein
MILFICNMNIFRKCLSVVFGLNFAHETVRHSLCVNFLGQNHGDQMTLYT